MAVSVRMSSHKSGDNFRTSTQLSTAKGTLEKLLYLRQGLNKAFDPMVCRNLSA